MMSLTEFKKSHWNFIVYYQGKIIFRSKKHRLLPLINYLKKNNEKKGIIVFDKTIGRAAALLLTLIKPRVVYTLIISLPALRIFKKHKIKVEYFQKVRNIIEQGKICLMEELSKNKKANNFYRVLCTSSKLTGKNRNFLWKR